jgi:hypothetical protein
MDITSLSNLYRSQQLLQTSSTTQVDPVQKAFSSASARLAKDLQATSVQVSAYGQVKAGFARAEDAGKALATATSTTPAADTKKGLQALVTAYNETRGAAAGTAPGNAQNAANDLRRTLSSDANRSDLRALGITQQKDGSLALDTKALDSALQANSANVRAVASRVGGQVEQTATRALATNGNLTSTLNTLNARAQGMEARQAEQQGLASASQQSVQQISARLGNSLSSTDFYQRIFSL